MNVIWLRCSNNDLLIDISNAFRQVITELDTFIDRFGANQRFAIRVRSK